MNRAIFRIGRRRTALPQENQGYYLSVLIYRSCFPLNSYSAESVLTISSVSKFFEFALEDGEQDSFRKILTSFLASIPYSMRRKDNERERERYFQYTFYLLLRLMSVYTVYIEKEQSEGRVDCIVETPKYVYIFEFKLEGSAEQALQQIENKGYARPYETDERTIYKIGVNFSSATGTIEDWISLLAR